MAKGQMRSNREKKKPKQDKPKSAGPAKAGTPVTSLFQKPSPGKAPRRRGK